MKHADHQDEDRRRNNGMSSLPGAWAVALWHSIVRGVASAGAPVDEVRSIEGAGITVATFKRQDPKCLGFRRRTVAEGFEHSADSWFSLCRNSHEFFVYMKSRLPQVCVQVFSLLLAAGALPAHSAEYAYNGQVFLLQRTDNPFETMEPVQIQLDLKKARSVKTSELIDLYTSTDGAKQFDSIFVEHAKQPKDVLYDVTGFINDLIQLDPLEFLKSQLLDLALDWNRMAQERALYYEDTLRLVGSYTLDDVLNGTATKHTVLVQIARPKGGISSKKPILSVTLDPSASGNTSSLISYDILLRFGDGIPVAMRNFWPRESKEFAIPTDPTGLPLRVDLIERKSPVFSLFSAAPKTIGRFSNAADFGPKITAFTPLSGLIGSRVVIDGTQFTGATKVQFGGAEVSPDAVSPQRIVVTVPALAKTGTIKVIGPDGTASSNQAFVLKRTDLSVPFASALTLWLPFENQVADISTLHHPLTASSGVTTDSEIASFDGASGGITVPDHASLRLDSSLTLAAWVQVSVQATSPVRLIDKRDPATGAGYALSLIQGPSGWRLQFTVGTSNAETAEFPMNQWQHLAVVYDRGALTFYRNGVAYGSGTVATSAAFGTAPFLIGADQSGASTRAFFKGWMDDVRVYAQALSANDVLGLFLGTEPSLAHIIEPSGDNDGYESNNLSGDSTPIALGSTVTARISSPQDIDWFKIEITEPGVLQLNLTVPAGKDYDLHLIVSAVNQPVSAKGSGQAEEIVQDIMAPGTYYFRVYGYPLGHGSFGAAENYILSNTFTPSLPTITDGPHDTVTIAGFSATFAVTANGNVPFSYQWLKNGAPIADETSSRLVVVDQSGAENGNHYSVQLINRYGTVTSSAATLTVNAVTYNNWTHAVSNDFNDAGNWSLGHVPRSDEVMRFQSGNVSLSTALNGWGVITGSTTLELLPGGAIAGNWTNNGRLVVTGGGIKGTLFNAAGATVELANNVERLQFGEWGENTNAELYDRTGLDLQNAGTVIWSGSQELYSGQAVDLRTVRISNLESGLFDIQGDAALHQHARINWIITNAGTFRKSGGTGTTTLGLMNTSQYGGGLTFTNTGTVEVLSGTLAILGAFNNNGTVQVNDGALQINGGGESAGVFSVGSTGLLDFAGGNFSFQSGMALNSVTGAHVTYGSGSYTFYAGTSAPGAGTLDITGGITITGPAGWQRINLLPGGAIAGNWTNNGRLVVTGGGIKGTLFNAAGATVELANNVERLQFGEWGENTNAELYDRTGLDLQNAGTVIWSGSQELYSGQAVDLRTVRISNLESGLFDIQGDAALHQHARINWIITNAGTFRKSGGTGTTTLGLMNTSQYGGGLTFTNTGTVEVQAGALSISGVFDNTGSIVISPGTQLIVAGGALSQPAFTTQPLGQSVPAGGTVMFTAAASGFPAPTYQWRKSGTILSGATSATLTIAGAALTDVGTYDVVVTNSAGSVTSTSVTLTVNLPPTITTQPTNQTVTVGAASTFTLVANGIPAPTYQWQRQIGGTGSFVDVNDTGTYSGATTATLTITGATLAMLGDKFQVVVTNSVAAVTSTAATLTVQQPPAITSPNTVTFVAMLANTFTITATASPTPAFSATGIPAWATLNATTGVLSGMPPDTAGAPFRLVITASNSVTPATTQNFTLNVQPFTAAPTITMQPANQVAVPGETVTFTVVATGTPAPTYLWKKGAADIVGATNATLTLANVQTAAAGTYVAVVGNSAGTVTSNAATLTVNVPPSFTTQPANQTVNQGATATFTAAAAGAPVPTYQWKKGAVDIVGATNATLTLTNVQPGEAAHYSVIATNVAGSTPSNGATLTVNVPPAIVTQPASQTVVAGQSVTFMVAATGAPAPTFQWKKGAADIAGATNATLAFANAQPTDAVSYTVVVTNAAGSITSTAAMLTVNVPPVVTTQPANQIANQGATATFTVAATGTPAPTYQWTKGTVDIAGATNATLTLTSVQAADATNYSVVVTNVLGRVTSTAATLTVNVPPVITTQPASQTVSQGGTATFTATASGAPAPTYQWKKDATDIGGAMNATLTLTNVQPTDAASYTVAATNVAGSATSNPATLTVNVPPAITTQPMNQAVVSGQTATFAAVATGTPVPAYQWRKNGTPISGATNASYAIAGVQATDAGSYDVVVSSSISSVSSHAAELTVVPSGSVETYTVSTLAGSAGSAGAADGTGGAARFNRPNWLAVDGGGNVFVADTLNHTIRKITAAGVVTTFAGTAGSFGGADGIGSAARFYHPEGVAVDGGGNVFVSEYSNQTIRKITPGGVVTTLAGAAGSAGSVDGTGSTARFRQPEGMAVDNSGNVFIADAGNNTIRKIAAGGAVTTLAGTAGIQVSTDGTGSAARFSIPGAVALDGNGNLFVCDQGSHTIRKITASGVVTTLAGAADHPGNADGVGGAARFNTPDGVALDSSGNVYVADGGNHTIRKITADGLVTTIAGAAGIIGGTDGTGSAARFNAPIGLALDSSGNLYVGDNFNHTIRKLTVLYSAPAVPPTIITPPVAQTVNAGASVYFTVVTTGTPTPTYQWRKGGTNITGATEASYTIASTVAGDAGSYDVVVSNGVLPNATSQAVTLTVNVAVTPPTITSATAATATVGTAFSYTITGSNSPSSFAATGLPPGLSLNPATGVISGAPTAAITSQVSLTATNAGGTSPAVTLTLTVNPALTTTKSIASRAMTAGTAAVAFTPVTAAGGTAPYSFAIAPALPIGLTLNPATGAISGTPGAASAVATFTVTVTDSSLATASNTFSLAVNPALISTLEIASTSLTVGSVVTAFTHVTAAGGTPSYTFSVAPALPAGLTFNATTGAISGTPAAASATTTYTITVADSVGAISSKTFSLTVTTPTVAPTIMSATTATATVGTAFAYTIMATNAPTSFTAAGLPAALTLNATIGLISGTPASAGTYTISLTAGNAGGTSPTVTLTLTVNAAPAIATQPTNVTVNQGQSATFSVVAYGTPAPTYQWRKGGVAISGATNSSYTVASAQPADAGSYGVVVTNSAGSVTSNSVTLTVNSASTVPVLSQAFGTMTLQAGGAVTSVDLRSYFTVPGLVGTQFAQFNTVLGKFNVELRDDVAPRNVANFLSYVQGGDFANTFLHRATSFDGGAVSIVQGGGYRVPLPPNEVPKRAPVVLEYNLPNARGTLAAARTTDINSATSEWYFNVRDNSTILSQSNGGGYTVFGRVIGTGISVVDAIAAVPRFNAGSPFNELPARNVSSNNILPENLIVVTSVIAVSLFPAGTGGSVVEFSVQNSSPTVVGAVLSGSTLLLTPLVSGSSTVTIRATDSNGNFAEGTIAASVSSPPSVAPAITTQPQSSAVFLGQTAVFSTTATGTPAPDYQWRRKPAGSVNWAMLANGAGVSGANSSILYLSNVGIGMSGDQFQCLVSNIEGGDSSSVVTLTVSYAPPPMTFSLQPYSAAVAVGANAIFTASVTGYPVPTLQWQRQPSGSATWSNLTDDSVYSGVATSTLILSGATIGMNGDQFRCVATNSVDSVTSTAATLTVGALSSVTSVLTASGTVGTSFNYTVTASNTPTSFNAVSLPAGLSINTSSGVISGTPTTAGAYSVTLSANNAVGTGPAVTLTLTVSAPATIPVITVQPMGWAIVSGQTRTLSVTATGTAPLSYQWYQGTSPSTTTPVSGATLASFTTPALTATTSYWVRVTNSAGSVDSATAVVTVTTGFVPTVALTSETTSEYLTTGGAGTYRVRVTYTGQTPSAIGVAVTLPAGWTFAAHSGASAAVQPSVGDNVLEWAFSVFPANELTFTFTANYPSGQSGSKSLTGTINYRPGNLDVPFAALTLTPISPPTITTQPASKLAAVETGTTFTVAASGTGSLSYQWRKEGVALVDGGRISGATTATLSLANLALIDAGSYTVVVANAAGGTTSNVAVLTVVDARATHAVVGAGYFAGGTVTITQTLTYNGAGTGLTWQMLLPAGWSYASDAGSVGASKPTVGATNLLEWTWATVPASPVTFTVTLNVPAGQTGDKGVSSLAVFHLAAGPANILVKPEPLIVSQVTNHSADTDRNFRISLVELTRVIELYNSRNGSTRTGCYALQAGSEDGFAPDPTRAGGTVVTFASYHSADEDRNGRLSLTELTRVIELYNYRNGTTRTGQYRALAGTEDGFAPGP